MDIQQILSLKTEQVLKKLNWPNEGSVSFVENPEFGDLALSHAFSLAKKLQKAPREVAKTLAEEIEKESEVAKAEVAGAGFVNVTLEKSFFNSFLDSFSEESYLPKPFVGKKVLVEHSSPNLFKPFHIGHLVNNAYGEAIARILKKAGADVVVISWPSDVSPGIAKAVWGLIEMGVADEFDISDIEKAYPLGVKKYEESETVKKEVDEITKIIYTKQTDKPQWKVYERGRELSLEYFQNAIAKLNSSVDVLLFESDSEKVGKELVLSHLGDIFEKSDGAIIFRGSKYGLYDSVFINSAGFGTYLAKDLGLVKEKFDRYSPDLSITITDIEQKQHFELVLKVAELIDSARAEKTKYLHHGRMSLPSGRISSREGGVPLAEDVLAEVAEHAFDKMQDKDKKTAEQIALSAVKFQVLKVSMGKNMVFDFEKALSFEGDSGPYLQYTYARAKSLLAKAKSEVDKEQVNIQDVQDPEKELIRFPYALRRASLEFAPHYLVRYLLDLSASFNSWYAKEKVLGHEQEARKRAVVQATATVLKEGLEVLGIPTPERM